MSGEGGCGWDGSDGGHADGAAAEVGRVVLGEEMVGEAAGVGAMCRGSEEVGMKGRIGVDGVRLGSS